MRPVDHVLAFWQWCNFPFQWCNRGPWFSSQRTIAVLAWIIERLDRKLADAIGSNIVEKCDVTLSRAIQPFWASYFSSHISLSPSFDYTYWPCLEVKGEEDLLLEKTVREYKTGWGKRQSKKKLTTLDKMILLAVKLSRLDVSSTQLKRWFTFPFKFIYWQPVTRSRIWEMYKKRG